MMRMQRNPIVTHRTRGRLPPWRVPMASGSESYPLILPAASVLSASESDDEDGRFRHALRSHERVPLTHRPSFRLALYAVCAWAHAHTWWAAAPFYLALERTAHAAVLSVYAALAALFAGFGCGATLMHLLMRKLEATRVRLMVLLGPLVVAMVLIDVSFLITPLPSVEAAWMRVALPLLAVVGFLAGATASLSGAVLLAPLRGDLARDHFLSSLTLLLAAVRGEYGRRWSRVAGVVRVAETGGALLGAAVGTISALSFADPSGRGALRASVLHLGSDSVPPLVLAGVGVVLLFVLLVSSRGVRLHPVNEASLPPANKNFYPDGALPLLTWIAVADKVVVALWGMCWASATLALLPAFHNALRGATLPHVTGIFVCAAVLVQCVCAMVLSLSHMRESTRLRVIIGASLAALVGSVLLMTARAFLQPSLTAATLAGPVVVPLCLLCEVLPRHGWTEGARALGATAGLAVTVACVAWRNHSGEVNLFWDNAFIQGALCVSALVVALLFIGIQYALASRYRDLLYNASVKTSRSPRSSTPVSRVASDVAINGDHLSRSPVGSVCTLLLHEARRELALLQEIDDLDDADLELIERWTPKAGDGETQLRECVAELKSLRRQRTQ